MNDLTRAGPAGVRIDELTGPLPPTLEAAVRSVATDAETADGVAPLSEAALLALGDPEARATHLLARESDGLDAETGRGLVGYACLLYTSPSPRDRQKSRM